MFPIAQQILCDLKSSPSVAVPTQGSAQADSKADLLHLHWLESCVQRADGARRHSWGIAAGA